MSRKNRDKYFKTLHRQAHEKLVAIQAFGDSKAKDKLNGADNNKIYSFATYKSYRRAIMRFIKYVEQHHPECTTLKKAKRFANEWLQSRVDADLSAWTIAMENSAISKLYGILPDDQERFRSPPRRREDIKRSRGEVKRDRHFSVKNNDELIKFVCATGTRRSILEKLRGDDLWSRERMELKLEELSHKESLTDTEAHMKGLLSEALGTFEEFTFFCLHRQDKGGKFRFAPIWPENQDLVIRRMTEVAPDELVFRTVHSAADIHFFRAEYAKRIYRYYARDLSSLPYDKFNRGSGKWYQSDVYVCRSDEKGRKLDRAALLKASKALGHNRIDVISRNYLYGL